MSDNKYSRFTALSFDKFKELAQNEQLSATEKIGFPDEYRSGYDQAILADIIEKCQLTNKESGTKILDIGAGCGNLIKLFIDFCREKTYELQLIDSQEMLDLLPNLPENTHKLAGFWPDNFREFIDIHRGTFDSIITYSVFHYTFEEANIYDFIDKSLELLKPNGRLLIGDIPNISKRNRFFSSDQGIDFHRNFVGDPTAFPNIANYKLQPNKIDDGILLGLMARYRNSGYNAYLLPQAQELPMSNRREDLVIIKL